MPRFRFAPELDVFLAPRRRGGRSTPWAMGEHETLKHAIEALGVPHTEAGEIRVNGRAAPLTLRGLSDPDEVEVYGAPPVPAPPEGAAAPRFIADAHLARLARYLRFAGVDTLHRDDWPDTELAALAQQEQRIVLTRDRALLMHRHVERGCYVRPLDPVAQLEQVMRRFALRLPAEPAGRCLLCNTELQSLTRPAAEPHVPLRAYTNFECFWRCPDCTRVYWRGSHWRRMRGALERAAPG
ncbi:Mut7-C ubiquitin/RNAse domain-containing protein [Schlegelella sp. S2-27]|uniref:Mut7-C ubiquitin/RNAse domain-containing protein n=1 Tax=Caldimonas mangrovi TaxID=2944811 RepID=A0ABT0YR75_9BURK|nr:Mut7-C RNAse domain-containing protein [Caldimonas mangrovi]MCM5681245.1 Mut7-C ubiquitin/RNAse domain-containing protein [Caldimonas mangrovi]